MYVRVCVRVCVHACVRASVCVLGEGRGVTPHMHGHKEIYKDLYLKSLTEWDPNPRPHELISRSTN